MSVLLTLCSKLRPSMMQHLLRRLVFDVPLLNEHTKMPLKVSTLKYFLNQSTVSFNSDKNILFTLLSAMYTLVLSYYLSSDSIQQETD